jgi:NAD(P)-dependent dehydrogenase (short-subunit alcohol dehydrogenase family)
MAVCVVTGAAGALGESVSRRLARDYRLVLVNRSPHEGMARQARELKAGVALFDVSDAAAWTEQLAKMTAELGEPPTRAALVAGGWSGGKSLHEAPDDEAFQRMLRLNLETVHQSLRALLPAMVAQGNGSIVLVGSRVADRPWSGVRASAYTASKAAAVALAEAVAAEVLMHGVCVNAVLPSTLDTPANRAAMPKANAADWVSTDSCAEVIAFLLSDAARDVSGARVPVYGKA